MKISVDDKELFTLTETQKKVIHDEISVDIFEEDMKRRIHYILMHKYERCFDALKMQWMSKLKDRYKSIPTDDEALAKLIFSQPDYKCRKMRDAS